MFLALGDHNHRRLRRNFLHTLQSLQPGETGHVFIENHQIEMTRGHKLEGVAAIVDRHRLVAFRFQEEDVGLQEVNLIICPQDIVIAHRNA